jgi:rubrerythrin
MPDDIDREIAELQAKWAEQKRLDALARQETRHAHRVEVREQYRRGELPDHFKICVACGRGILGLDPMECCPEGRNFVRLIY